MAIMNRVYATLLVLLVVLCQVITAYSEKTPVGDLSSAQIEEQIQVGPLTFDAMQQYTHSISNVLSSNLSMLTRLQQHMRLLQASQPEHSPYCSQDHLLSTHSCSLVCFLVDRVDADDTTGAFFTFLALPISCLLCVPQISIRHL